VKQSSTVSLLDESTNQMKMKMKIFLFLICSLLVTCAEVSEKKSEQISSELITKKTNNETKKLYSFLKDNFGENIISGQQDLTWLDSVDMSKRVFALTGKYPALMGYDFMNYYRANIDHGSGLSQVEEAIEWHKKGGIVTFCWHWRDPSLKTEAFYTKDTDFRINLDDSLNKAQLIRDIDLISTELKKLQDAGVPVLWRPLHEASGAWFWWGANGAESSIALWKLMVERMRDYHKLSNLIWVHNGQHPDWYPGDEWVDIIGEDIYAKVDSVSGPDYSSQLKRFERAKIPLKSNKIIALTENGIIPNVDEMLKDKALWSWFCTWNDGPNLQNPKNFFSGTWWNSHEHKKTVFHHKNVLTLDNLNRNY